MNTIPIIALIGAPNVGKSTLFNRLTKTRNALVGDVPGVTRDRQYGHGTLDGKPIILIDTGGIGEEDTEFDALREQQALLAVREADAILFMVDGRAGLSAADETIASRIRKTKAHVYLVVNKIDGVDIDQALADFHGLGFGEPIPISAAHSRGLSQLREQVLTTLPDVEDVSSVEAELGIRLTIVGRPNVGKSTLINRILGEERVLVYDKPGTTMDSIAIPFKRRDQQYTLYDTAGVRRRSKVSDTLEKFSVIKTLKAIESSHVVILVLDASETITDQDLHILQFIIEAGKSIVIAINKWDGLDPSHRERVTEALHRRLNFVDYVKQRTISALHGTGVGGLFPLVQEAYESATREMSTAKLTECLAQAVQQTPPPLMHGRRAKLKYAHIGGYNPPTIVIHGNQVDKLSASYRRYLEKIFRKTFKLVGTPVRLIMKTSDNPFKDIKNKLTPRQQRQRGRMIKHRKKKNK